MTITGGVAPVGGGVVNAGLLTLERTDITHNLAQGTPGGTSAAGGGVYSSFVGAVTVADSVVQGNLAGQGGGGVWMFNGTVTRSLIDSNLVSSSLAGGGIAGGVYLVIPATAGLGVL